MATTDQVLMSATAKTVFKLNGQLVTLGERLAAPADLTGAGWQVLGPVLAHPRTVAEIAREVGVTRQSVQRIADLLVAKGLAGYEPNPAHRRAKLLRATDRGRAAVARIAPGHRAFARRLTDRVGSAELAELLERLRQLSVALDELTREGLPRRGVLAGRRG